MDYVAKEKSLASWMSCLPFIFKLVNSSLEYMKKESVN